MAEFDRSITLAMTGASGAQYGLRLLECLVQANCQIQFLISEAARVVVETETELTLPGDEALEDFLTLNFDAEPDQILVNTSRDWFSPVASGSAAPRSMVICPASGGTISAIACGASNNLIERAADVVIKEKQQLIVVPRETPLSELHLENLLKLARLGVTVMPAMPGFYQNPQTIDDLVDFLVARLLDHLNIEQSLLPRWGG
ncbi:MAG: aromatic acid decarboxylase [Porticoccus sp.]|jgi:flavin prenyltransferase|uniref:flavin prenyltransferase UbiX n=1 Tax=Porticoccus hydrocarbonoclasticus TaxID=1073414 RepID=UPI000560C784|nr:flavin prenyltransferase UbiX [Porticoccus hydrocarbonoclasticus]MBG57173.1 aromatic acid decarboxylase [Porticoccus sp.]|tara:strand:+ start:17152 stop:17760 length:609 start_codon:yes stop_codon:yes gene_type:complete